MQSFQEIWRYLWIFIGLGGLVLYITGLRSGYRFLRKGIAPASRWFILSTMVTIPFVAITVANSMMAGFGPGAWMWLTMWVAVPFFGFTTLKSLLEWWNHRQIYRGNWFHLILGAIVANALVIAPYLGEKGIAEQCDKAHQLQLRPIIEGMEEYRANEGIYPIELDLLFPEYVSARPQLTCFGGATDAYRIEVCDKNTPILVLENYTGGFPIRYYPPNDSWSRVSFLDGTCSFLD